MTKSSTLPELRTLPLRWAARGVADWRARVLLWAWLPLCTLGCPSTPAVVPEPAPPATTVTAQPDVSASAAEPLLQGPVQPPAPDRSAAPTRPAPRSDEPDDVRPTPAEERPSSMQGQPSSQPILPGLQGAAPSARPIFGPSEAQPQ